MGFWKCKISSRHDSLKTSLTESKLLLFLQSSPPCPSSNVSACECEIFEYSLTDKFYYRFVHVLLEKYFIARSLDLKRKSREIDIERNELLKEMFQYIIILAKQGKQYAYQEIKLFVSQQGNMWSADCSRMISIDEN
jgi:hypothetical protein